jgi:hypothetical protein
MLFRSWQFIFVRDGAIAVLPAIHYLRLKLLFWYMGRTSNCAVCHFFKNLMLNIKFGAASRLTTGSSSDAMADQNDVAPCGYGYAPH